MVVSHLSERRVQDTLNKVLKLPNRTAAKKPLLTKAMKKKRLGFRINKAAFTRVRQEATGSTRGSW
jgi:hypothetical protein